MIKATHKTIQEYLAHRGQLSAIGVVNEGGVSAAFYTLLQRAAPKGWLLIPQETLPKSKLRPDGTLKDDNGFRRGYWEAKDSKDDLDREIEKKRALGYPTSNIIYEDSRQAVLIQNKGEVLRVPLSHAQGIADLLNNYYAYTEPHIEEFEKAVDEFKDRVPDLALGLLKKIEESHKNNREFRDAFSAFHELCKTSLNPSLRQEAVEEMLVQHLLTERLIGNIFDNPEFRQRNVIAAEIEKVIQALTGKHFNRQQYMEGLNRFYMAIEGAAKNSSEFSEKQHLLNSVYERFFQGYAVKVADTHGIVYTPQPIVDFMCASVVEVLKTEFNKDLGDPDVCIIDPCTGTGNFIVNLLHRIPKVDLPRVYKTQLFANEVMLMPYYIAALNIEHAYFEITGKYEPFEGLCFVDTLDLMEAKQSQLGFMSEKNLARVERQRKAPITVVIGNPPYNTNQLNENDNNKNRAYDKTVDPRIQATYTKDSKATLRNKLSDPYVRFFRWATDRLESRGGIVSFVTNNGFFDGIAFDGFRKHIAQDFDLMYHFDCKGNARTSGERRRQEGGNIFEDKIRVGVGISVMARLPKRGKFSLKYHVVGDYWKYPQKAEYLEQCESVSKVKWQTLKPDAKFNWLAGGADADEWESGIEIGSKEAKAAKGDTETVFKMHSLGIATNRDDYSYSYSLKELAKKAEIFVDVYNRAVDELRRKKNAEPESLIDVEDNRIKWTRQVKASLSRGQESAYSKKWIRRSLYRPFNARYTYFDDFWVEERYKQHLFLPTPETESENVEICVSGISTSQPFHAIITNRVPDLHTTGDTQCFPFYVYNEDGSGRRENITDWALAEFKAKYGNGAPAAGAAAKKQKKAGGGVLQPRRLQDDDAITPPNPPAKARGDIGKWDIFYYVYGMLHSPEYRTRYADNLKRELPRIPFAPDFWAFSNAGKQLAELHLKYEESKPYKLKFVETPKTRLTYRVEKMKLIGAEKAGGEILQPRRLQDDDTLGHRSSAKHSTPPNPPRGLGGNLSVKVNDSLMLSGIPAEVLEYKLGNRSALEWVIDQYQIKTDKRSGITHDPNREDDEEYIVRLIGQVVQVSLETVRIVKNLPQEFR